MRQSKAQRAAEEAPEVLRLTRAERAAHGGVFSSQTSRSRKYDLVLIPGFRLRRHVEHAGATFLREEAILFRSVPTAGNDKIQRARPCCFTKPRTSWFRRSGHHALVRRSLAERGLRAVHGLRNPGHDVHPPDDIWKRFYQSLKPAAYAIDATHGTTPIHQDIANLKDAKSAYGAIVHIPKRLWRAAATGSHQSGTTAFRDGVAPVPTREHAYANAEWSDLIHAYERASGKPLAAWADAWIRQRGMPQVDVVWSLRRRAGGEQFELRQHDALGGSHLWPLRTQILLNYEARLRRP